MQYFGNSHFQPIATSKQILMTMLELTENGIKLPFKTTKNWKFQWLLLIPPKM